jgi:hypothetical protein
VDAAREGAAARGADATGTAGAGPPVLAAATMSSTDPSSAGAAPFDNTE